MISDYIQLAVRSLTKRRLRTYLTMIGIFIGIAAVVSLIGLGQGLRLAITSQFGFIGTDVLGIQAASINFAGAPGQGAPNPLMNTYVDKIKKINNVKAAFNRYIGSATIEFKGNQKIEFVVSVPGGEDRKIFETMNSLTVQQGRLLTDQDTKGILLGSNYHTSITYGATFDRPINAGDKVLINGQIFDVVGILEKKGSFIYDDALWMNDQTMLREGIKPDDGTVNIINVQVKDVNQIEQTQQDIEKLLRKERNVKVGNEDFTVQTPQQALATLNSTLFAVQLFVTIIAVISLLVGGIGIMNTMFTAVLERTKEIGIMKSIGARNSTIFTLFFLESGLLGMIGGLIGVTLGIIFANGMAFIGSLALGSDLIRASISPGLILGALAFSFVMGTFFGVLPAYRASRLNPVDSLRGAK
jgi:putative ABC transport system permease protein